MFFTLSFSLHISVQMCQQHVKYPSCFLKPLWMKDTHVLVTIKIKATNRKLKTIILMSMKWKYCTMFLKWNSNWRHLISFLWLPIWMLLFIKVAGTEVQYHCRTLFLNFMLLFFLLLLIIMFVFKYYYFTLTLNTMDDIYSHTACCFLFIFHNISRLWLWSSILCALSISLTFLCDAVVPICYVPHYIYFKISLTLLFLNITKVTS